MKEKLKKTAVSFIGILCFFPCVLITVVLYHFVGNLIEWSVITIFEGEFPK